MYKYKNRLLFTSIHYIKTYCFYIMGLMCITGIEHSSIIICWTYSGANKGNYVEKL